jgi:hypothetical protein
MAGWRARARPAPCIRSILSLASGPNKRILLSAWITKNSPACVQIWTSHLERRARNNIISQNASSALAFASASERCTALGCEPRHRSRWQQSAADSRLWRSLAPASNPTDEFKRQPSRSPSSLAFQLNLFHGAATTSIALQCHPSATLPPPKVNTVHANTRSAD